MGKLKDKLFYFFAEKNMYIKREYFPYVMQNIEEHYEHHAKHAMFLFRLNWHYRILHKKSWLNKELEQMVVEKEKSNRVVIPAVKKPMPYEMGAESSINKPMQAIHFARTLMEFPVVSFDVFDTLIIRPFAEPADLFYIVGERLNMPEFYRIRREAEKNVKETNHLLHGTWEANIEEIYEYINRQCGLEPKLGIEAEFQVELDYCKANPYMLQVFRMCKEQGKHIIIITDMYLLKGQIEQLLNKNGYEGYETLYVSSEYGCGKGREGGPLYEYVAKDYNPDITVHIGDNQVSDIDNARKHGFHTRKYMCVHMIGKDYRTTDMSDVMCSAYSGIVNYQLHNGIRQYSPSYEYGFIYGGLYVLGYCNWMYKKVIEKGLNKILFLSRDGAIYKMIFEKLYPNVECEYFLWSRLPNVKYSFKGKRALAFESIIDSLSGKGVEKYTIKDFLEKFDLLFLNEKLYEYKLSLHLFVDSTTQKRLLELFNDYYDEIISYYEQDEQRLYQYISQKVGEAKKIAIVDVGWQGSAPLTLKYIIEDEMQLECEVNCWCAAVRSTSKANVTSKLYSGEMEAYMFSGMENRDMFASHTKENQTDKYGLNYAYFEMFTQAQMPGFEDFKDGGYRFQTAEVENYNIIREIHQGIIDFCELYYNTFRYDSFMLNISGCDAYRPFRFLSQRGKKYFDNFNDFVFPKGVSLGGNCHELNTIKDLK